MCILLKVHQELVKMTIYHASAITLFFSQETCDDNLNITMCPLCDGVCDYWRLSTVCSLARASYLFDNGATVLFAIFMSLWGKWGILMYSDKWLLHKMFATLRRVSKQVNKLNCSIGIYYFKDIYCVLHYLYNSPTWEWMLNWKFNRF